MTSPDTDAMGKLEREMQRDVRALYDHLIAAWNARDAKAYAALFTADGSIVGFDGSMVDGRQAIEDHLTGIFAHHKTPSYVTKTTPARYLAATSAQLRAIAGLVPPGGEDINPAATAVQTLVAVYTRGWQIVLFQNTPLQLHGRDEERNRINDELRQLLRKKQT